MKTVIIAAIARNGVIGNAGGIPWSYPEDMKHFKDATTGHAVVMGRKTWESLPARFRPLPWRTNCIVSETKTRAQLIAPDAAIVAMSLRTVLSTLAAWKKHEHCYIIGGAQLYAAALPLADELDLTLIDKDYEGDVKFPGGEDFADPLITSRGGGVVGNPEDGWKFFECVERRHGTTPELTFTRWLRR